MELLDLYSNTVRGVYAGYEKRIADAENKPTDEPKRQRVIRSHWGRQGRQMVQLLDALAEVDGPRKWARDDHGYLIILPKRHIQLREQVKIRATGVEPYKVTYWLPDNQLPWEQCSATAHNSIDAARLITHALTRCEQDLLPRSTAYDLEWILADIDNGRNGNGDPESPPWLR